MSESLFSFVIFSLFRLEAPCDGCAAPYGFRHAMPLTIDTKTFAVSPCEIQIKTKTLHIIETQMEFAFSAFASLKIKLSQMLLSIVQLSNL